MNKILALSALLLLFSCGKETQALRKTTAQKLELEYKITEIGTVIPAEKQTINALSKGAIVELKEHGTAVKKGDTLLRVSTEAAETRIEERQNELEIDNVQQDVLKDEKEFILFEENEKVKVKKKQYEIALFEYEYKKSLPLKSTIRALEIDLELAEIELEESLVTFNDNKKLLDKGFITQTAFSPFERRVKTSQEKLKELKLKLEIEKKGISKEELVELKTNAERAKKEYLRAELAKDRRVLDLEQRKLVVDNRIEKSLYEIDRAEKNLKNTTIKAEKDGGLFVRYKYRDWRAGGRYYHYEIGQDISKNTLVGEIIDKNKMQIRVLFNEADFNKFRTNQAVEISIPALPSQKYTGKIISKSEVGKDRNELLKTGQGKAQISLYSAIVSFDAATPKLNAGMTAEIFLKIKSKKTVLAVPRQSVFQKDKKTFVFVKTATGREAKEIKAKVANDFYYEVKEGLQEGDEIFLNAKAARGDNNE